MSRAASCTKNLPAHLGSSFCKKKINKKLLAEMYLEKRQKKKRITNLAKKES